MKRLRILFCLLVILIPICVNAQNAPGVTWKKIETKNFTIIYPQQIEKDAKRVADTMEHLYPYEHKSIGYGNVKHTKTTVLLFTQYADSNGISTLLPRRTEWYNAPPQTSFGGVVDWYQMLGIHEYRHICQFDSLNTGLVFGLYCMAGETGQAIGMATVPGWYFEGDAVMTETLLSNGGRGRMPSFDAELRALLLNGKRYGYYKAMLGSYVDHDPLESPYLLGYFMNGTMRRDYGLRSLEKIKKWRSYFLIPYSFDLASGIVTGEFPSDIYEKTMTEMTGRWRKQTEGIIQSEGNDILPMNKNDWTVNKTPCYLDDQTLAVVRSGQNDPIHISSFNHIAGTGREKLLADVYPSEKLITSGGGKVAWAETIPDIRWTMRSYSDLFIKIPGRKEPKRLTRNKRYYAPSLSSDGSLIAAVEYGEDNVCSIALLDAETGLVREKIPAQADEFIMTPCFTPDAKQIIYCAQDTLKGKALKIRNLKSGEVRILIPHGWENFTSPVSDGTSVFYSSEYSGIDNIYAADIASGKRFQVTSRLYGAYTPAVSPDGKKLAYSDLTANGYQIVEADLDKKKWTPLEKTAVYKVNFFEPLLSQESESSVLLSIPETGKKESSFFYLSGTFSPHTWLPWVDTTTHEVTLALQSANALQTVVTAVGGKYNYNEKTASAEADISYLGAFPVFEIGGIYGNRYALHNSEEYSWFEKTAKAGVSIPLNFSRGLKEKALTIGSTAEFRSVSKMSDLNILAADKSTINTGQYMPISYFLQYVNADIWANDIKPRWGQVLNLSYTHTPYKLDYKTSLFSAGGQLYFPGLFARNSLHLEGGYEFTKADSWPLLSSNLLFPRGYKEIRYKYLSKGSINYIFPLFYPENHPAWTLYLAYVKQIYANMFFDAGYGEGSIFDGNGNRATASTSGASGSSGSSIQPGGRIFKSAGAEVIAEVMPFSMAVSLNIGYRYSFLFDARSGSKTSAKEIFFLIQNPLQ